MIYKGCEKRMIKLKSTGSSIFEEAYFVLNSRRGGQVSYQEMIREANRIVGENSFSSANKHHSLRPWVLFLTGLFCGAGFSSLIFIIVG